MKNAEQYLQHYQNAINKIEDYFEYSNQSEKDKLVVMEIVDELSRNLSGNNRHAAEDTKPPQNADQIQHLMHETGVDYSLAGTALRSAKGDYSKAARILRGHHVKVG